MARSTYIYHVLDNWDGTKRAFTVKWEMVKYCQENTGSDPVNKRFRVTRFRDGQDVAPERFLIK